MNNKIRQNTGFTLVEVIISIAVLSILCIIFLQLFVKAKDISDKSSQIDQSVRLVASQLDTLKGMGSLSRITNSSEFEWMKKEDNIEQRIFKGFLNEKFEQSQDIDAPFQLIIEVGLAKGSLEQVSSQAKLYHITAKVYDTSEQNKDQWIYSAETLAILEK